MQISRQLLLTCAVAACLTPIFVHAADNEAQIRARQALEEKMNQVTPPPAAVPTNPAPAVSKPKAPAQKPVVQKPAPPVVTVTPNSATVESQPAPSTRVNASTPSVDPATRQKLQDALNQSASTPKPAVQEPAPPAVTVTPNRMTVESQPPQSTPSYVTTPSNDDATNQKLQEALRQKMQQTPVQPAESATPPVATQKPRKAVPPTRTQPEYTTTTAPAPTTTYSPLPPPSNVARPGLPEQPTPQLAAPTMNSQQPVAPTASLPALTGPPSPLSQAKQQKLNDLLQQYRIDQLTPQQYHEQRAKILSEP